MAISNSYPSGFTANSIGDRLQNASTVATTGRQIAAYTI